MPSNYIQKVKALLATKIDVEDSLLDLYALLVVVRAHHVTWQDVHDAWSVWKNQSDPEHKSLVPFDELTEATQEMDAEYALAIKETAEELNIKNQF